MPSNPQILICVPVPTNYFADCRVVAQMEAWGMHKNVEVYYPATSGPEIGQDKAVMIAEGLDPKPTHILFVDYDVIPPQDALQRLLAHDKDIVSGTYPVCLDNHITWCLSTEESNKLMEVKDIPKELFEATVVSNGMMLVKMEVFEELEWPYFENRFTKGGISMGHDIDFCQKARDAGFTLWVDPTIKCQHFKNVELLGIIRNYINNKKE